MKNPIVFFVVGAAAVLVIIIAICIGIVIGHQIGTAWAQTVPVKISYRRSLLGNGYVFRVTDTGSNELFCTVTVRNSTQWKRYRLDLRPNQFKEIGALDGWQAFPGDTCEVEAEHFTPMTGTIPEPQGTQ